MVVTTALFAINDIQIQTLSQTPLINNIYQSDLITITCLFVLTSLWLQIVKQHAMSFSFNQTSIKNLYHESENDLGNVYDLRMPIETLTLTFFVTGGLIVLIPTLSNLLTAVLLNNILLVFIFLLTPPTTLTLLYGGYLFNYIKGNPSKNSLLMNVVLDGMALLAFFARFSLQMLRYCLVLVKVTMVSHFFREITETNNSYTASPNTTFTSVINVLKTVGHYAFEMVETFLIYYAQTGALAIVVVWLLSALYSYGNTTQQISWFSSKRHN